MSPFALPTASGSYRWYYVDVSAGDITAVAIFMIGSIFSPKYSRALAHGACPRQHAAVNFALYEKGKRRHWVLSEYPRVETNGDHLEIGKSTMSQAGSRLIVQINDVTALWGTPLSARIELTPEGPSHAPVRLVDGLSHHWHPIAPRARAKLTIDGQELEGRGYHDGNHGEVPLGSDLRGWEWTRSHTKERTTILDRPWTSSTGWQVEIEAKSAHARQIKMNAPESSLTAWGLPVPRRPSTRMLESSPFYARMESGAETLGEVADFQRFHQPWIRWMASLRTRVAS